MRLCISDVSVDRVAFIFIVTESEQYSTLLGLLQTKNKETTIILNVGKHTASDTASHSRSFVSSVTEVWGPQPHAYRSLTLCYCMLHVFHALNHCSCSCILKPTQQILSLSEESRLSMWTILRSRSLPRPLEGPDLYGNMKQHLAHCTCYYAVCGPSTELCCQRILHVHRLCTNSNDQEREGLLCC